MQKWRDLTGDDLVVLMAVRIEELEQQLTEALAARNAEQHETVAWAVYNCHSADNHPAVFSSYPHHADGDHDLTIVALGPVAGPPPALTHEKIADIAASMEASNPADLFWVEFVRKVEGELFSATSQTVLNAET